LSPRGSEEGDKEEAAMMIERDMLYAHMKTHDLLKPAAVRLLQRMTG
jgi:hypothetical protein